MLINLRCTEDLLLSCPFSGDGPREQAISMVYYKNSHFALRALAVSIANIVQVGPCLWGLKRDNSIVQKFIQNDAQQSLQYFFQVRPSILHLFSSLITLAFIRCYSRLKPSISTFHSFSFHLFQLLQLLKILFRLLFSQWQYPRHNCSRAVGTIVYRRAVTDCRTPTQSKITSWITSALWPLSSNTTSRRSSLSWATAKENVIVKLVPLRSW